MNHKLPDSKPEELTRSSLLKLSLGSGLLWVLTGAIIIYFFQDLTITEVLTDGAVFGNQLLTGTGAGVVFGLMAALLMKHPSMEIITEDYFIVKEVKKIDLKSFDIFQISVIAGITEEFLFRAAIQPLLGVWLTSLIFVAIHGYISFKSAAHITFALFVFLLSTVLGMLFIYFGILSAMAAHAVYDIIVLYLIRNKDHNTLSEQTSEQIFKE